MDNTIPTPAADDCSLLVVDAWGYERLNMALFVQLLHSELDETEETSTSTRHIIRFRSRRDYTACVNQIRRLKPRMSRLDNVQCLSIIHAISCCLRSDTRLVRTPHVHSVESDIKMKVHGIPVPKRAQKSVRTVRPAKGRTKRAVSQATIPWGVRHIRAPLVWRQTKGAQIHIGVIDTGVDYSHPDLKHSLSRGINLINRQLLPTDDNGHGTHIAGTIAAASKDGVMGVAPKAIIHPVKAFDHQGSAFVSDIISGIDWCVMNDIRIINMSFGMKSYSRALEAAVKNAYLSGTIIVASSGNDGNKATVDYPARFPQTIAVGASTRGSKIAPFSNRGRSIDIFAPGDKIYSTWLRGKYNELSGTSMATSHVSGVIALMLEARPGMKPPQIKSMLLKHSISLKGTSFARELHAARAVAAASKGASALVR
jgi:subtilisin